MLPSGNDAAVALALEFGKVFTQIDKQKEIKLSAFKGLKIYGNNLNNNNKSKDKDENQNN